MLDITIGDGKGVAAAISDTRWTPGPGARLASFGVVGLGYWGPNLARVLAAVRGVELRWLCDTDFARLDLHAPSYPGARLAGDLDELLDDDELDGVLLATPVFTHFDLARRCLEAGKHTFVEKPLATTAGQASSLVELARDRNLVLMCGHTFLYSPAVRVVRDLIAAGDTGELYFISSSRVNLGLHRRDVGVIWDLGPHDFSILLHWLGAPPRSVRVSGRDSIMPGVIDVAFVTLEFDSGLIANVELSWLAPSKLRRTVIVGSKRMIVYVDGAAEPIKIYDRGVDYRDPETFGEYHLSYRSGDILAPRISSQEPLVLQIEDFVERAATRAASTTELELARDVVRIAEAATASLEGGGASVELERQEFVRERR